jgi:hypothetical protein
MQNGRPADGSFETCFNYKTFDHVDSLEEETDVEGWFFYISQIDNSEKSNTKSKYWNSDGSIEIDECKNGI